MTEQAFEIIRDYPLERNRSGSELPFEKLEVGDAMWVPGRDARSLGLTCNAMGRKLAARFIARTEVRDGIRGTFIYRVEGRTPPLKERAPRQPKAVPADDPALNVPAQAAE